jgi:hypothetical protein
MRKDLERRLDALEVGSGLLIDDFFGFHDMGFCRLSPQLAMGSHIRKADGRVDRGRTVNKFDRLFLTGDNRIITRIRFDFMKILAMVNKRDPRYFIFWSCISLIELAL